MLSEQKNDCVTKFADCEKNMTLVKKKWEFLDMDDKMHYKNKITNLQDKSSKLSKKVRQIKVNLGNEIDRTKLNMQAKKGVSNLFC